LSFFKAGTIIDDAENAESPSKYSLWLKTLHKNICHCLIILAVFEVLVIWDGLSFGYLIWLILTFARKMEKKIQFWRELRQH